MFGSCLRGFPLVALLLASGCSSNETAPDADPNPGDDDDSIGGGQTGEENFGCLPVGNEPLALDAASPLGFSAAQLLAALGAEHNATLTYADGSTTPLQVAIEYEGGGVEFVDRAFRSDGSGEEQASTGIEIALDCSDVVEVEVTLTFATDDGAFDEAWPVTLSADTASTARAYSQIALDELTGSFELSRVDSEADASRFDAVSAELALDLVGTLWSGDLSGLGEDHGDTSNPDSVVSATSLPIATF